MASGDETLKGSKYLWLYSRENVPERRRDAFQRVRHKELKVGRAWAITESLRRLWHYVYPGVSQEVLEALVLLGHAQSVGTYPQRSGDGPSTHRQHPDLLPASGDQRDE